jgi:ABC-type multidrug transport system ATPase subunit
VDTTEKMIEVNHLSKRFDSFEAVKDVSFTVNKGDVFGFLGPNGAGKSTTIRCMLSLITPTSGDVKLFGKFLASHRSEILKRVGCIIEKPDFYKYLSAERNLEIFARISGVDSNRKDIHRMLDFVGLNGREKHKVSGFSHGMKQRLGIAQSLLHNPDMIILDEPTTGLDPQGIIDIRNLILQLSREQNKTILLSSHQLSEIEIIANRMVIINRGVTVIEGEVAHLLNAQELIVRMEVNDVALTLSLLKEEFTQIIVQREEGNVLHFSVNRNHIPDLIKKCVARDILIYAIESKRKLEDYFIQMVTN